MSRNEKRFYKVAAPLLFVLTVVSFSLSSHGSWGLIAFSDIIIILFIFGCAIKLGGYSRKMLKIRIIGVLSCAHGNKRYLFIQENRLRLAIFLGLSWLLCDILDIVLEASNRLNKMVGGNLSNEFSSLDFLESEGYALAFLALIFCIYTAITYACLHIIQETLAKETHIGFKRLTIVLTSVLFFARWGLSDKAIVSSFAVSLICATSTIWIGRWIYQGFPGTK